jgi:hypothetical protein
MKRSVDGVKLRCMDAVKKGGDGMINLGLHIFRHIQFKLGQQLIHLNCCVVLIHREELRKLQDVHQNCVTPFWYRTSREYEKRRWNMSLVGDASGR